MILEKLHQKIISSKDELLKLINHWKDNNEIIVFTNGCFDIIHPGHITYLAKSAQLGTKLIIGINTDKSVSKIKGKHRPILDQNARALALASMLFVDAVVFFSEETPLNLIETIIPNILVKGKDYNINEIVGYNIVVENGGKVETIELVDGYSTSLIEEKIIKANKI